MLSSLTRHSDMFYGQWQREIMPEGNTDFYFQSLKQKTNHLTKERLLLKPLLSLLQWRVDNINITYT